MLRSFYSGISGMRNFQTKLDVVANNVSNVNTTGFKGSRVMFQDVFSQTLSGATQPDPGTDQGGINPKQVGMGSTVSAIDTVFNQGSPQMTNVSTDLYIDGDGFFAVTDGINTYLTRAGDFKFDAGDGTYRYLVNSQGLYVLQDGSTDADDPTARVTIPAEVTSLQIGQDGTISYIDNMGTLQTGDQIGVVVVLNPEGLEKAGNSLYQLTNNTRTKDVSGTAVDVGTMQVIAPNNAAAGSGALRSGFLEMSNVDLTQEFTEMIIAQRGFQANSRIITTSDEVLQEVVNLKR